MDKENQIEEMARAMCAPRSGGSMNFKDCIKCPCDKCCLYQELANSVYHAGYRKQIKGEWIYVQERADVDIEPYICSCCEGYAEFESKYCLNCGAEMEGGE